VSFARAIPAGETITVFQRQTDGYNVFRIPALVRAANGDLLAFCEAREAGDASAIDLVMKRSQDQGRTWSALMVVQSRLLFQKYYAADRAITVGNPAPVVDLLDPADPGRIWLPFTVENDRVFVTYSDDHGATWSAAREITADVKRDDWGWYATGPVHSIQIQNGELAGRLVVPADHRLGHDGADDGPNGAQVIFSDDHGLTWHLGAVDDTYEDGLNANETAVVELADGRLYFNTRDQNGEARGTRGAAFSQDGGRTFQEQTGRYRWFVPESEVLDAPVVQCAVLGVPHPAASRGQLLLFSGPDQNGPSGPGRSDLRIRLSFDQAATWQDGPLIHTGPAAYSDMVLLHPDVAEVGILFECGETGGSPYDRIAFTSFSVIDLTSQ
jgi:sialidase-1